MARLTLAGQLLALASAVATLALVAAGGAVPVGLTLGALSWCLLGLAAVRVWTGRIPPKGTDGPPVVARTCLVVALGLTAAADHAQPGMLWAAVAVLVAAMATVPLLVRLVPEPDVANLPGVEPVSGRGLFLAAPLVTLVLIAAAGLLCLLGASAWWWALVALVQLAAGTGVVLLALRRRAHRAARLRRISRALAEHRPTYALYTARPGGGAYQVAMWLPYVELLGAPYVVVVRHAAALRALAGLTDAPVVVCRSWADLDHAVVPSLRVALYVNSLGGNADFLTYRQMCHVYLGHGDSDKELSVHPMHIAYDRLVVPGQAAIDRYAEAGLTLPSEKLLVTGRPQAGEITAAGARPPTVPPTVLYAPTWAGYNTESSYSSLRQGTTIVRALLGRGCRVIFRPHPLSRQRRGEAALAGEVDALLHRDAVRTGTRHQFGGAVDGASFAEAANASDAMVGDVSSVLTDYLHSNKPLAVVDTRDLMQEPASRRPVTQAAYIITSNLTNLGAVLDDLLGEDSLKGRRARVRDYVLGTTGDYPARFVRALSRLAADEPEHAPDEREHAADAGRTVEG